MPSYFPENNAALAGDSLERSMAKVVGGLPPALDFMFGSFYRNFVSKKTLNHGIGSAINFTRASNATFFDADGTLKIAGTNVPRFDHDPVTGESRGLLIEEARTNSLQRSAELDDAAWSKTRATITANAVTAPDGTSSADKLIEDTTPTNSHRAGSPSYSVVSGTAYTFSVFLKSAERANAQISMHIVNAGNAFTTLPSIFVNLDTGAITNASATVTNSSIASVGNGWWRVSISATATSSATQNAGINLLDNPSGGNYTGDGTSGLYIWGAQLEAGAFPTSYIPTTSAAATRAADSAVVTPISSFYNQIEGTVFAEYAGARGNRGVLQFNNNTNDERIGIITSDNRTPFLSAVSGATSQAVIGVGSVPQIQDVIKFAGAFKRNDFQAARGGTLGVADTSGNMPAAQSTHCYIGSIALGGNNANCHIRKIAYWPKRLPDTLLRQLTT
jgi:hypothetical protein